MRAEFIKLLLEKDLDEIPLPAWGLRLEGAWITGQLFLRNVYTNYDIALRYCLIQRKPTLIPVRINSLNLVGARAPGLLADRLVTTGGVFLREAEFTDTVSLRNAKIDEDLVCRAVKIRPARGVSDGEQYALRLEGCRVGGAFYLDEGAEIDGLLDLTDASIGRWVDDEKCWPIHQNLILKRCRYEAFVGEAPVDARSRLDWLALQDASCFDEDFWPQPYEQLAKVFREMGHLSDARAVLIRKEKLQRRARRAKMALLLRALSGLRDGLLGVTVRFGRAPMLAFAWLAGLAVLGALAFVAAEQNGAIAPNTGYTLRADEWVACGTEIGKAVHPWSTPNPLMGRRAPGQDRVDCFRAQPEGEKYPEFNAAIYSLDTLLPIVDLEMQNYWIPDETADWPLARAARWYLWLHIALGWGLSLLAVAGFSGWVKSD